MNPLRKATAVLAAALLLVLVGASQGAAAPAALLSATYVATVPATAGAGTSLTVAVTVTNTGDEVWLSGGPNPVNLSYHWYDASLVPVVWEGQRTPLGADVAPGASRTIQALVMVPATPGQHVLRFSLVREGQAWFTQQSDIFVVQIASQFGVRFGSAPVQTFVENVTYTIPISMTNTGTLTWDADGPNPITLSYHWHDGKGNTVVWDGLRTELPRDVVPGASVVVNARVRTPAAAPAMRLSLDLVREGVGWFQQIGGTNPLVVTTSVETPRYLASYGIPATFAAVTGEARTVPVTVRNAGNVPWNASGANPVSLSYHLFDSGGRTVVWDGARTRLTKDVEPGGSVTVQVSFVAPKDVGVYSLNIDAVREGLSWFSGYGVPAGGIALTVTSGFNAGYTVTTTPLQATIGAALQLSVDVVNYGPRTLTRGQVSLSYHIHDSAGRVVVWDGRRGILPRDIPAGATVTVPITVQLPSAVGSYRISWDLVQEGAAWFSQLGIVSKIESISVQPGVTFYGKGFGHAVGMSQYGAQGLATGAAGARQTGEQIVAHYYPGTTVGVTAPPGGGIRVLLSAPSSQGRFNCSGTAYMSTWLGNITSPSGFQVLNEGARNAEIGRAGPGVTFQVSARNGIVEVWDNAAKPPRKIYSGAGPVVTVPLNTSSPTKLAEKGFYRGNLRFTNLGNTLRAINFLSYDDYLRGVVPLEMPTNWHAEAYKAQALAARSYAFTSYKGGSRDYDVTDDQADQCYGGVQLLNGRTVETAPTSAAISATLGKVILHNGEAIRAYFSSSSGGYTKPFGCWGATVTRCAESPIYLRAVADPADLAVTTPSINRHASWTATYTSADIRAVVARMRGIDIGTLLAVDLSNRSPGDVGHAVSVIIRGSNASVELPAEGFFRSQLGLKSSMVRLAPW